MTPVKKFPDNLTAWPALTASFGRAWDAIREEQIMESRFHKRYMLLNIYKFHIFYMVMPFVYFWFESLYKIIKKILRFRLSNT